MDVKLSAGQAEQLSQALRNEVNEDFVRHLAEGGYSAEAMKRSMRCMIIRHIHTDTLFLTA